MLPPCPQRRLPAHQQQSLSAPRHTKQGWTYGGVCIQLPRAFRCSSIASRASSMQRWRSAGGNFLNTCDTDTGASSTQRLRPSALRQGKARHKSRGGDAAEQGLAVIGRVCSALFPHRVHSLVRFERGDIRQAVHGPHGHGRERAAVVREACLSHPRSEAEHLVIDSARGTSLEWWANREETGRISEQNGTLR